MLAADNIDASNQWHYTHWAMFIKSNHGVSTCSNHSEGFHSGFSKISQHHINFLTQITNLLRKILKHISQIKDKNGKSLYIKCCKIRDEMIQKLENDASYAIFCNETCNCGRSEYLSALYGTTFPCIHSILSPCVQLIKDLNLDQKQINLLILIILKTDKESKAHDFDKRLFEIYNTVIKIFHEIYNNDLLLRNLIETIVKCIHIEPAECLDVALDFQSMEIME